MLIGCSLKGDSIESKPTNDWRDYSLSHNSFQVSEECPFVCWLGINPGISSDESVFSILNSTEQIMQQSFQVSDSSVRVNWYVEKSKYYYSTVFLNFENHIVESIEFYNLAPFLIEDLFNLLGEPSLIRIEIGETPHEPILVYSPDSLTFLYSR